MKSAIVTMIKKELARFFGDKRTVFSTIILPGLLIFVLYNFMGSALSEQFTVDTDYDSVCYVKNLPESLEQPLKEAQFELKNLSTDKQLENAKEKLTNQALDLLVCFPEDFENEVKYYDIQTGQKAPEIRIFYNSANTSSREAYERIIQFFNVYESSMTNKFDVNSSEADYDLATEEDSAATVFASMLPMLLLIFLFSGAVSVAPESIAGEKERGTIATLLITPAKRGEIAVSKILSLSFIAVLSGLSSTVGTVLSLPKLMGEESQDIGSNVYSFTDYLILTMIIISTVLVMVTAISLISAFAKSVKEAQTFAAPLVIIIALIGATAMFGGDAKNELYYYCIPLYNSIQCMISIFKFSIVPLNMIVTVLSNLFVTLAGAFALTKMFQSERIIFTK